jgi:hypothetical protein
MISDNSRITYERFRRLLEGYHIACDGEVENVFNVFYYHLQYRDGSDLYVTSFGVPFIDTLHPQGFFTDREWFRKNAVRLSGTSTTYRVRTKPVEGRSKDIVIKYNRMGQDVPGAEESSELSHAVFNSPFEEFSLVMELKEAGRAAATGVVAQKPLAIYVPAERRDPSRMGRREFKMQDKIETHAQVKLDMFRPYVVIYEWIKGIDAAYACREGYIEEEQMVTLTRDAELKMKHIGFIVKDQKPHHVIIRPKRGNELALNRRGEVLYGVIDYELLSRTKEREEDIKQKRRMYYLSRQKNRFASQPELVSYPHLKHATFLGVDYVYGRAESTDGILWVVGRDPGLFDYFLPERWEHTPRTKLSANHEIYHTLTKDGIHLVWKVSKVGMLPDVDPFAEEERRILEYGFNSPFEEVSFALELSDRGIRTVYPRAIYMFGKQTAISETVFDKSRYKSHRALRTQEGDPILRKDHSYIIIWGYWNGPDEKLAEKDGDYLEGISALSAYRNGIISRKEYMDLLQRKAERLARVGMEDLHLRGSHVLLSLVGGGELVRDAEQVPDMRICNFELLKRFTTT